MRTVITTDLVEAYLQCQRKAFFIDRGHLRGVQHEYEAILKQRATTNRKAYLSAFGPRGSSLSKSIKRQETCKGGSLVAEDLTADCDALSQPARSSRNSHMPCEPLLVVGTHSPTKWQRVRLAFAGLVTGEARRCRPEAGYLVLVRQKPQRVRLEPIYPTIRSTISSLRQLMSSPSPEPPHLAMNQHCPTCPFRQYCLQEAEDTDNLSLLERMTPKLLRKYQAKGIFSLTQLSHVFRPRRRSKRAGKVPATFNVELQALALRSGKTYLNEVPSIPNHPVELFLDIEGVPDEDYHYLIGLVIKDHDTISERFFWADSPADERAIFEQFTAVATGYGDAPIFHYGSYEARALRTAERKYKIMLRPLTNRLVNVNPLLFGKVYFPSRSNRLKDLGSLVGAKWDSPNASGLQSLVWRMQWEDTRSPNAKKRLVAYNMSDCHAVRLLVSELRAIEKAAASRDDVDFANDPKHHTTDQGASIHAALERILWSGHAEYRRHRIRIRPNEIVKDGARKLGAHKGHPGYVRIVPAKANKTVRVRRRMRCPARYHQGQLLEPTGKDKEHTVIDLVFSKNGCRKTVTKYVGAKTHCARCNRDFLPPAISRLQGRLFGHSFQAWAVYQRVVLRLPYTAITGVIDNLFSVQITKATIVKFVRHMADGYGPTERVLLRRILASPFIHVDETKLSIQGTQNYVWVLTNGSHVVFRLTETRETALIQGMLAGYEGVLVSDFYGGYDSVGCRQQKCLVHLIGDLNDDLWKNPFNEEVEQFVGALRDLLVPVFEDVERYGLKARHLSKHSKAVDHFYRDRIAVQASSCEVVSKYQKRFQRYRESMFLFLQHDGIPWNNNTAERAIRHLAIQRKISGSFYRSIAVQYLRLLGIGQTCRFQGKSLLRFLLSEEKELDAFREAKRPKSTRRIIGDKKADNRSDRSA